MATAAAFGAVHIIYPFKTDSNGNQSVVELLYELALTAEVTTAI